MDEPTPQMAGGTTYPPATLLAPPTLQPLPTGYPSLDLATGGVGAGSVWSVTGPRGAGVSALVTTIATRVAVAGDTVMIVNGHLPPTALAALIGTAVQGHGYDLTPERLARLINGLPQQTLRVASWYALPHRDHDGGLTWDTDALACRLVVYDTVDEMLSDGPGAREERVARLRDLRTSARGAGTAVLITTRLAPDAPGHAAADRAWRHHPWNEAVSDVADVHLTLSSEAGQTGLMNLRHRLGADRVMTLSRATTAPLWRERPAT